MCGWGSPYSRPSLLCVRWNCAGAEFFSVVHPHTKHAQLGRPGIEAMDGVLLLSMAFDVV